MPTVRGSRAGQRDACRGRIANLAASLEVANAELDSVQAALNAWVELSAMVMQLNAQILALAEVGVVLELIQPPQPPPGLLEAQPRLEALVRALHARWRAERLDLVICVDRQPWTMDDYTEAEFRLNYRFTKRELYLLKEALIMIPDRIITPTGHSCEWELAMAIMLRRLAVPDRLSDLEHMFQYSGSSISAVFGHMIEIIHNRWGHLLQRIPAYYTVARLQDMADTLAATAADDVPVMPHVIGFVDGVFRRTCRPVVNQHVFYSGYKKAHGIKFEGVHMLDGMFARLYGPVQGSMNDPGMLLESGLVEELRGPRFRDAATGTQLFCLFGDSIYPHSEQLQVAYVDPAPGSPEAAFNRFYSQARVSVEWGFGRNTALFSLPDLKKKSKILLSTVGPWYVVGALLANAHNCLHRNQTAQYFDVQPPRLHEYFVDD